MTSSPHAAATSANVASALQAVLPAAAIRASADGVQPYGIADQFPDAVVFPESAEQVAAVLHLAHQEHWAVVPWGAGLDIASGRAPIRYSVALSLSRLTNVLEHDVENLTLTAEAGLSVEQANRAMAKAHQIVPLGFDTEARSLGGIVAMNRPVPRRLIYGDIRDQLLGLVVAMPDGRLVRFGRKVIKNVAGYDMAKLFTGSAGMLGVIVEVTLKGFAMPDEAALAIASFESTQGALAAAAELYRSALAPAQLVLMDGSGALRCMGRGNAEAQGLHWLCAGFEGRSVAVRRQTGDAAVVMLQHGGTQDDVIKPWSAAAAAWLDAPGSAAGPASAAGLILRLGAVPPRLGAWAERLTQWAAGFASPMALVADYGGGWIRARLPVPGSLSADQLTQELQTLRTAVEQERGYLMLERAPVSLMDPLGPWGEMEGESALMGVLRRQMDPQDILSPGRFL
jgi:FAD/FMN-containing dehydrogenase